MGNTTKLELNNNYLITTDEHGSGAFHLDDDRKFYIKGSVSSTSELPSTGNEFGDVWIVIDPATGNKTKYYWDGVEWELLTDGAYVTTVDDQIISGSTNPVQSSAIQSYVTSKVNAINDEIEELETKITAGETDAVYTLDASGITSTDTALKGLNKIGNVKTTASFPIASGTTNGLMSAAQAAQLANLVATVTDGKVSKISLVNRDNTKDLKVDYVSTSESIQARPNAGLGLTYDQTTDQIAHTNNGTAASTKEARLVSLDAAGHVTDWDTMNSCTLSFTKTDGTIETKTVYCI